MDPEELKDRLRGVLAFTPTPFTSDDKLDLEGLKQHVDFLCRNRVNAIVVCGGVGEFFSLEQDEYRACIRTAVQAVGKRVPVLSGIGYSTRVACQLARFAESAGADGLMICPPYFVNPADDGIVAHYRMLAASTRLGLVVYSTGQTIFTPPLMERLAEIASVVALKDEYGDLKMLSETIELLGNRMAWINGMAESLAGPYFVAGAQAFTSGLVNFAPQLSLAVWEAGAAGRWAEVQDLVARKLRPLIRLRERKKGYQITVIKEAMNLLGMPGGAVRLPLVPLSQHDRQDLIRVLEETGLMRQDAQIKGA